MQISKGQRKNFLLSMMLTFFVLFLFTGFVIVEKNTRFIAFGDDSPFFTWEHKNFIPKSAKIHFMGKDYVFNF